MYNKQYKNPCYVGPCLHGMAHTQVVDGGDDLQIDSCKYIE